MNNPRAISRIISGNATEDGAGVKLVRFIPAKELPMLDPFLLLDVFKSDNEDDFIAGFPPHPHRGFETVTYLLRGQVRHRDSAGHQGVVKSGGVQWMTAGRGIEHSEMPERDAGRLEGFQLWINLAADEKMREPGYQEVEPADIPEEQHQRGTRVRVIAGQTAGGTSGPVTGISTDPLYLDVSLPSGVGYRETVPQDHNAFIYLISGAVEIAGEVIEPRRLAVLDNGDAVVVTANTDSRFLLVAARPIDEPVARHGPFVMNTAEEIQQAYRDYQAGLFGRVDERHDAVA